MHRLISLSSGALILLFLNAGVAQAGDRPVPRYELGGFGGIVDYDTFRGLNGNIFGGRFAVNVTPQIGIEAGIGASNATSPRPNIESQTIWMSSVDLVVTPVRNIVEPYIFGGLGSLTNAVAVPGGQAKNDFSFDAGGGIKVWMHEQVALRADVHGYWASVESGSSYENSFYRDMTATVGVSVGLGNIKPAPIDTDQDGVADDMDRCAGTPFDVAVDSFGCPPDADQDGVPDHEDRCASTPAKVSVDAKGCPVDSDADGVFDGIDVCSNTPKKAQVDVKGCPIDSDGDGVFDGIDRCAGTPTGSVVNAEGCPQAATPKAPKPFEKWLVLRNVTFSSGKAEITPGSFATLDEIAAMLAANPDVKIEVRGYADSKGSADANLSLTQRRAEAVRQYLIQHGIEAARVRARGYGEADPVASNETSEGRAMNRRVELHRLD